jgi:hypothetical protein
MCSFGLLILNNIRQERKRISPFMIEVVYNHHIIRRKRQIDNEIYFMLFIQCLIFIITNIPVCIDHIYLIFTEKNNENFSGISQLISLIGHCVTFYFYLLSSQLFRREVTKFGKKIIRIF